jgi:hypothetical protein
MIDESIFTLLRTSAGVASLVSENSSPQRFRIYPLVIPQHEDGDTSYMPCVVYTKIGTSRGVTKSGTDTLVNGTYQIDCYATTYLAAAQLANAVRNGVIDHRGTVGSHYFATMNLENEYAVEDPDPGLYRISQTWSVWYVE